MDQLWTRVKGRFHQEPTSPSKVKLIDRSKCPEFLNLRKLTDDPDLRRHISAHARQLKLDLDLPVPGHGLGDSCTCSDRTDTKLAAFRLGKMIASNAPGWQDALTGALVGYVASHLSASIEENLHGALTGQAIAAPRGGGRQGSSSPVAIIDGAGVAIAARLAGKREREGLQRCAVLGALLNQVVRRIMLACDAFVEEKHFREYRWVRDPSVVEAFDAYLKDPSNETFEVVEADLRRALLARKELCVCRNHCRPNGKDARK